MLRDKLCVSDNVSVVIVIASRYDEDSESGPGNCMQSSSDLGGMFD